MQLFQHIHPEHVEPERYAELKKIVAVCRMRASGVERTSALKYRMYIDEVGKCNRSPQGRIEGWGRKWLP